MWSVSKTKGRVSVMSKFKRTVTQLCKEFCLPLVVAISWAVYNGLGQAFLVKDFIASLMPAFFLASWMTGQIFRVRKQAGVEASFNDLQSRMGEMIEEFQEKALSTIDHITGGDSYCYAEPQLSRPTYYPIQWMVRNAGAYPMYQVAVKIDDLNSRVNVLPGLMHMDTKDVVLGDIPCHAARHFEWRHLEKNKSCHFSLTFEARNGTLIQDVIIKWINEEFAFAYRLKKNDEESTVLKEVVPAHFPKGEDGSFDWSEPPISEYDVSSFLPNREQLL
jgi:hypothetical protein